MQKHRSLFPSGHTGTQSDIQHCLRLNDLDEIGDGTHYLDFHMLGLFSFRQMSVQEGIDWWMEFLGELNLKPQVVTIHPDCPQWSRFYDHHQVEVRLDPECKWSDGSIGGYCTEFYRDGVEIGNIVNPLGTCLDCGFGSERIQSLSDQLHDSTQPVYDRSQVIDRTIGVLLDSGVSPSNQKQGYVLRRLLREQLQKGHRVPEHPCVDQERVRLEKIQTRKTQLLQKYPQQTPQWFWETHGIPLEEWS
jgi:alanyl-tRNA synthetase